MNIRKFQQEDAEEVFRGCGYETIEKSPPIESCGGVL